MIDSLYLSEEQFVSGKCGVGFMQMIASVRCRTFKEIMSVWLRGVLTQNLILYSEQFVANVL